MPPRPSLDLDWMAISWGGPDEPVAEACSMCDEPFKEDDVPLMIWNSNGWAARFCDACASRWWIGGH